MWSQLYPQAQCLVAPCGTKFGKSFGCALWLSAEALAYRGMYCVWIAPTYYKCQIGYRYIKHMIPDVPGVKCIDSRLEIHLPNGSFIKFLHGHDAETTVEGDPVDRFVVDESGKQTKQLWFSLLTTITQTRGKGIITGTPRGHTWYYGLYKKAMEGDPFYVGATFKTADSPFIQPEAVSIAKKILPPHLFRQYYEAEFVQDSEVFGDLSKIWDGSVDLSVENPRWWVHPDPEERSGTIYTGWDVAKQVDFSVFTSINEAGKLVGYSRFNKIPYTNQVDRLDTYLKKFFPESDNMVRYDATGVGSTIGDIIIDKDLDVSTTPVVFSNKSKLEMVNKLIIAVEQGWFRAPKILQIESEMGSFGVETSPGGLLKYKGENDEPDDVVCSLMLSVPAAYANSRAFAEGGFDQFDDLTEEENQVLETVADVYSEDTFYESHEDHYN